MMTRLMELKDYLVWLIEEGISTHNFFTPFLLVCSSVAIFYKVRTYFASKNLKDLVDTGSFDFRSAQYTLYSDFIENEGKVFTKSKKYSFDEIIRMYKKYEIAPENDLIIVSSEQVEQVGELDFSPQVKVKDLVSYIR